MDRIVSGVAELVGQDGLAGQVALAGKAAAADDRFAHWPRARAALLLMAFAALMVLSSLVPITANNEQAKVSSIAPGILGGSAGQTVRPRDDDLALYDAIIARIAKGDNYYQATTEEQRRGNYPVRPGLAVRLPTLAYLDAALGPLGQMAAAWVLIIAVVAAWWKRMGDEPGGLRYRNLAAALIFLGVSLGLNRNYYVLHELWAGMLVVLSFGLHRPGAKGEGRWGAALAVAALALAIRELALPFVLLMGATAFWRRDWKESAAWSLLAAVFLAALAIHLQLAAHWILPSDRPSPSWLAFRGMQGWLSNIILTSHLRFLPHFVSGPLVILMMLGWASWRSPAGIFGTLLYLGYALAFMIAGRDNNFYWGAIIAPGMFLGLVFAPRGVKSLWQSIFVK